MSLLHAVALVLAVLFLWEQVRTALPVSFPGVINGAAVFGIGVGLDYLVPERWLWLLAVAGAVGLVYALLRLPSSDKPGAYWPSLPYWMQRVKRVDYTRIPQLPGR